LGKGWSMNRVHRLTAVGLVALLASAAFANAEDGVDRALRQLGRGMSNVATGLLEIPNNIHAVQQEDGDVAAVTYGALRGVQRFLVREVVGVFEIVTAPMGYEPMVTPEFTAHDGPFSAILEPESQVSKSVHFGWDLEKPRRLREPIEE